MTQWGPDGHATWKDERCGLGQRLLFNTPEALHERMPRWHSEAQIAITAEARLDNREELSAALEIRRDAQASLADGDLILLAYLKWSDEQVSLCKKNQMTFF